MALIKKKYVSRAYVEEAYCEHCGKRLVLKEEMIITSPPQFVLQCLNCGTSETVYENELPGALKMEYDTVDQDVYKVIALVGESGSGKDTMMKRLLNKAPELHEIVSCTSRPQREGEKHGVNYFYYTPEQFIEKIQNNNMAEWTVFNNWYYGTDINTLVKDKLNIGVFNPSGIMQLLKRDDVHVTVFYIKASDKSRLLRQLNREHKPDVQEVVRRYLADREDFSSLKFPYYTIENEDLEDLEDFGPNTILDIVGLK